MHSPIPHDPAAFALVSAFLGFVVGCWYHFKGWRRNKKDKRDGEDI